LLLIAKEAMSNSLRHAHASRITVALQLEGPHLRLEISDNGSGFNTEQGAIKGQGLSNLTSRASAIAAKLEVVSQPEAGCRVLVHLPQKNALLVATV
jgi:signal transduction histidine kinase